MLRTPPAAALPCEPLPSPCSPTVLPPLERPTATADALAGSNTPVLLATADVRGWVGVVGGGAGAGLR